MMIKSLFAAAAAAAVAGTTPYAFTMPTIDGKPKALSDYRGKVMLVVNTASKCGYTPQYEGLEKLHKRFQRRGLALLGFPENDFLWQEPGNNQEIHAFCTEKYGVTFDMFEKIVVRGKGQAPLYRYLTSPKTDPRFAGEISWNFEKFLISRKGEVIVRFKPAVTPEDPALVAAIEQALNQKP